MTEQAHAEPFMFPRATLMRMRGRFATVRYVTPGGIMITRSGEIASVGLKNVTVVAASGRLYHIPVASVLGVEIDTRSSMTDSTICGSYDKRHRRSQND
jgi:hypothetical protein